MAPKYTVTRAPTFNEDLIEAFGWIYSSNLEMGNTEEFADSKADQLEQEVEKLLTDLQSSPQMYEKNEDYGFHHRSVYGGRYEIRWYVNEQSVFVSVFQLCDLKRAFDLHDVVIDDED